MSDQVKAKKSELKKASAMVIATGTGYYKGAIIPEGKKFLYEGPLSAEGKLPQWVKAVSAAKKAKVKIDIEEDEDNNLEDIV